MNSKEKYNKPISKEQIKNRRISLIKKYGPWLGSYLDNPLTSTPDHKQTDSEFNKLLNIKPKGLLIVLRSGTVFEITNPIQAYDEWLIVTGNCIEYEKYEGHTEQYTVPDIQISIKEIESIRILTINEI